ncbi:hypothetical protein BBOV_II000480 [Babesia bovis T2Bo]|uniref:hypothetical protein n=1 Tax=Babesia bovis T2Bo TaxID=484906 RepID=UPI001C34AC69|nr:hypothetical protein BBOV_II000480 [Babesia bovis T2Bo]EDO06008.2 hypothetical protein BBOV_II000480 [Babesia bovis T2Bo]
MNNPQQMNSNEKYDLDAVTRRMLQEVADVFATNCITPWQAKDIGEQYIGTIKADEFVHVARQLGLVFTVQETRALLRQFKKHHIDYINIDQFVQLINNKVKQDRVTIKLDTFTTPSNIIAQKLEDVYNVLDWQKQNKLTTTDLKHFLGSLNEGEFGQKDIETLFRNANIKPKRNITKEEFVKLFVPIEDTAYLSLNVMHK